MKQKEEKEETSSSDSDVDLPANLGEKQELIYLIQTLILICSQT